MIFEHDAEVVAYALYRGGRSWFVAPTFLYNGIAGGAIREAGVIVSADQAPARFWRRMTNAHEVEAFSAPGTC